MERDCHIEHDGRPTVTMEIEAADKFRREMEALGLKARDSILQQPPIQFLVV